MRYISVTAVGTKTFAPVIGEMSVRINATRLVCVLMLKRLPLATIALLLTVYLFEHSGQLGIILRPLVIFGFSLGMLLALRRLPLDALDSYWAGFLSLTGVFAV